MIARNLGVICLAVVAVSGAAVVLLARNESLAPSAAEIAALAEAGKLDSAEGKLALLLKRVPDDPGANLLAAQLKMARCEHVTNSGIGTDPKPASSALEHLRRVDSPDKKLMSLVKLVQGKANRYLGQLDEAEEAWLEALRLDPMVAEAGWLLLQEYYLQGRTQEARTLALRLHRDEPDPGDRIRYLLEPLRQEVMPPDASSLVLWFEPIVRRDPTGLRANLALGMAFVRAGDANRGMSLLRKMVEIHPRRLEAWSALMAGLDEVGDVKEMSKTLGLLPSEYSNGAWLSLYQGRVAEVEGHWEKASSDYQQALKESPANTRLIYRLARVRRHLGDTAEANRLAEQHRARTSWIQEARVLYEKVANDRSLGIASHPDLYAEIAALQEKLGFPEQAEAWRRLIGTSPLRD